MYGNGPRRPYIVNGVFPQRLRVKQLDYPARIKRRLDRALVNWKKKLESYDPQDIKHRQMTIEIIDVYRKELDHFQRQSSNWRGRL